MGAARHRQTESVANVETLISQVTDPTLRQKLAAEVAELKKRMSWGLVFERHLPENVRLLDAPIKVGSVVWERRSANPKRFRVRAIAGDELVLAEEPERTAAALDAPTLRLARSDTLVEKDFAEPVFPAFEPTGAVGNGPSSHPSHVVIEGENYHALEALQATYRGQADVIYLDPPFNTGNRDWSYNNRFVDPTDRWRHSMWLAFMERRLRLARNLLKPNGVLVVAIDENEHAHLLMLLEQLFPGWDISSVSIVHNPRGIQGDNFSYTNEFAVFVVPGRGLVAEREIPQEERDPRDLRDNGGESLRVNARNCFYPIIVRDGQIIGFGDVLATEEHPAAVNVAEPDGSIAIWPIDPNGVERKWRYARQSVEGIADWLSTRQIGRGSNKRWDIKITKPTGTQRTVWIDPRYDSNAWGTKVIDAFAGSDFSFPKSLYNVHDVLFVAGANRPDALILDFFAGSGTTLHATLVLNRADSGHRRCVLVTNNEVRAETVNQLHRAGHFLGDPEFEAAGVFESACRPRVEAAITGVRSDGAPVVGSYLDGRPYAEGFEENVEFFRLKYLDPGAVELGLNFEELHPLFWMSAGGVGEREAVDPGARFFVPAQSPYAVLFDPSGMPGLLDTLKDRPDVTRVFVVAESEKSFADLSETLVAAAGVETTQLYRDYLDAMRMARNES